MSTLNPDRWKEISPHLDHALSVSEEERAAWLETFRTQRPDLADLLERLLREHRALAQERFLEHPPLRPTDESALSGQTIGAYRLISCIGRGGMGSVWLAERSDGRFERRVAVKFLNFAVATHGGAERFKREGSILGRLADPHIAELMDAGVTAKGEPYLVLEYVEGEQIDKYCNDRRLDVEVRIRLFLDVLSAVAHAHANLIVHRDLKPSNVLVRNDDQVKLLDFGIAKLLADDTSAETPTLLTMEGGGALTPMFAAPEQVTGGPVTTATDVYALGVLLYSLLTGHHPAGEGMQSAADLIKAIVETEPLRASEASQSGDPISIAAKRSTTPDKLRRQVCGDLDTILGKALKKNPQERYGSVTAFAVDLSRFLLHEPISARRDSTAYRAAKFVRRHRAGVAVALGLVLLVVSFAVTQTIQLRRIARERDRANRVTEYLTNMFKASDPSEARGNNITAREILDKASKEIDLGLAKDPELQGHMMYVMGDVYDDLGLYPNAESLLTRAVDIERDVLGANHPETLQSKRLLGWVLQEEGRYTEAEKLLRETVERERRVLGAEHQETLLAISNLGTILYWENRYPEAETLHRGVLNIERRVLGPDNPKMLALMASLGNDLFREGRYAEAEKLQREMLATAGRHLGPGHPYTFVATDSLAQILSKEGRHAEAEKLERETLATARRVLGSEHPKTSIYMSNLGVFLKREGCYLEAKEMIRQALEIDRRVFGPDHYYTAMDLYNLGCIAGLKGNRDEALALIRDAVDHGLIPSLPIHEIEQDPDLKLLYGDPRFAALLVHARERAAAQKAN